MLSTKSTSYSAIFFSYNKSANSTFCHDLLAKDEVSKLYDRPYGRFNQLLNFYFKKLSVRVSHMLSAVKYVHVHACKGRS